MPEQVVQGLMLLAQLLEIGGAGWLIVGFAFGTARYLREIRIKGAEDALDDYRQALARVILLGLEVLVAATIIKTIVAEATPESLGLLAVMIALRTIVAWSTVLEMTGRWPWQKTQA